MDDLDTERTPAADEQEGSAALERLPFAAAGDLLLRMMRAPRRLTFSWRGIEFRGAVQVREDGVLRLILTADLGVLPYSVEDLAARGNLLAVIEAHRHLGEGRLTVVRDRCIVLQEQTEQPPAEGRTLSDIVTGLSMMVLRAAPYLDLIAEYATRPSETRPPA